MDTVIYFVGYWNYTLNDLCTYFWPWSYCSCQNLTRYHFLWLFKILSPVLCHSSLHCLNIQLVQLWIDRTHSDKSHREGLTSAAPCNSKLPHVVWVIIIQSHECFCDFAINLWALWLQLRGLCFSWHVH